MPDSTITSSYNDSRYDSTATSLTSSSDESIETSIYSVDSFISFSRSREMTLPLSLLPVVFIKLRTDDILSLQRLICAFLAFITLSFPNLAACKASSSSISVPDIFDITSLISFNSEFLSTAYIAFLPISSDVFVYFLINAIAAPTVTVIPAPIAIIFALSLLVSSITSSISLSKESLLCPPLILAIIPDNLSIPFCKHFCSLSISVISIFWFFTLGFLLQISSILSRVSLPCLLWKIDLILSIIFLINSFKASIAAFNDLCILLIRPSSAAS